MLVLVLHTAIAASAATAVAAMAARGRLPTRMLVRVLPPLVLVSPVGVATTAAAATLAASAVPVSYTHLTLPTICSV
eukprot:7072626-Alexandrium_andersonii.AAC.1